jgi:hypothetical protein
VNVPTYEAFVTDIVPVLGATEKNEDRVGESLLRAVYVKVNEGDPQVTVAWKGMIENSVATPGMYVKVVVACVTGLIAAVFYIHHESMLVTAVIVMSLTT